jgi:hypothetical protein
MITLSDLTDTEREGLRRYSKTLSGNADALEVEIAIAQSEDGVVNATDLSWELLLAANRVRAQLERLLALGLLVEGMRGQKRWFIRQESPAWQIALWHFENWRRTYEARTGDG